MVGHLGIRGDSALHPPLGFSAKLVCDTGPGKLEVAPPHGEGGELGQRAPGPKRELQEAAEITAAETNHL